MTKPITSPKGKAIFPHLTEADYKFKSEGEYHVKLECLKSESESIIQTIGSAIALKVKEQHDENPAKAITKAPLPYEVIDDKVIFNFKMKASGRRKDDGKTFTQKPILLQADQTPLEEGTQIWGDSILRIVAEPRAYNMPIGIGCTLRLKTVQVIELVTGKSKNTLGDLQVEPVVAPKVKSEETEPHNLY